MPTAGNGRRPRQPGRTPANRPAARLPRPPSRLLAPDRASRGLLQPRKSHRRGACTHPGRPRVRGGTPRPTEGRDGRAEAEQGAGARVLGGGVHGELAYSTSKFSKFWQWPSSRFACEKFDPVVFVTRDSRLANFFVTKNSYISRVEFSVALGKTLILNTFSVITKSHALERQMCELKSSIFSPGRLLALPLKSL